MVTTEQILAMRPVMEAAMAHWLETSDVERDLASAIAAAINAWPGMACRHYYSTLGDKPPYTEIILPMPPQEAWR